MNPSVPPNHSPPRRRTPLVLLALALLLLGSGGLIATVWWSKRTGRRQAIETANQASIAFAAGRHEDAFTLFAAAAALAPLDPAYQKSAARAALTAQRKPEAVVFAKRAWDLGLRDEEVVALLLLDVIQNDRETIQQRGKTLIDQLPDEAQRLRMQARLLAEFGEDDEAAEAFRTALANAADAVTVTDYAELLARRQDAERLYRELQSFRNRDALDANGYRLLALAAAFRRLQDGAACAEDPLSLIAEAEKRHQYDDRLRIDHALHMCAALRFAEAVKIIAPVTAGDQRHPYAPRFNPVAQESRCIVKIDVPVRIHVEHRTRGWNQDAGT